MGRIIKGAPLKSGAYQLAAPRIVLPPKPHDPFATAENETDAFGFDAFEAMPVEAAVPAIDIELIEREATSIVDSAATEAQRILDDAHARARELVDSAAARAETIAREAEADAYARGHAAGTAAANADMEEMLATMRGLIEMAGAERHKIIEGAEPEIVKLAVGIAERVLHQQIALDRNVVVEMVKHAVTRLIDRERITVRVNPADLERMREHRDEVLALGDVESMRIIEDQRVDRGGVVLETDGGTVDAKISTQLTQVRRVLHIDDDDVIVAPAADRTVGMAVAS